MGHYFFKKSESLSARDSFPHILIDTPAGMLEP